MTTIKAIDEGGELSRLLWKISDGPIENRDVGQLVQWARRWLVLKGVLEEGKTTYKSLRALLLGLSPEPKAEPDDCQDDGESGDEDEDEEDAGSGEDDKQKKRKGHGRRAAKEYRGCRQVDVFSGNHKQGEECPDCVGHRKGRLNYHKPGRPLMRLRLTGGAPITGTVYKGHPLYCSKCGAHFAPDWPVDANRETYDASARAMITLMRHWYGFPSYRLEKLQRELGIPVPDATQADLIKQSAVAAEPVFHQLFNRAAQADMFILDDTSARIQSAIIEHKKYPKIKRYGSHVTGIIARDAERDIYLYRIGSQHAGENLDDLLAHRAQGMKAPLQMSDALAANTDHSHDTIVAYCLNHARGNFVDVASSFEVECEKVLEIFSEVFGYEAKTKELQMNDEERLIFHQQHSRKPMARLFSYLRRLLDQELVEENSGLAKAARYMLKREVQLTRFLQIPGAPLDSNAIERALKHAVLIRKNSLFYRNEVTAYNACILMTLAATSVHNDVNPLLYFTALLDNSEAVKENPQAWLPWNYLQDQAPRDG